MKMVLMRSLQLEHRIVTYYMAQNSMVPWKIKDIMKITIFLILSKSEKKIALTYIHRVNIQDIVSY